MTPEWAAKLVARSVRFYTRGLPGDASWRRRHAGGSVRRAVARVVIGTAFLLMIPLVGVLLSDEVAWNPFDFVVAGILLLGTGLRTCS